MTRMARVVAGVAALAVPLLGLLPVAHVHAENDHQLVHQHAIADAPAHPDDHADEHADDHADHHGTGFDHADHTAARLLIPVYDLTSHVLVCGPAGIAHRAAKTEIARPAPARRTTLLPTHDPPLRFFSSPAPPALV